MKFPFGRTMPSVHSLGVSHWTTWSPPNAVTSISFHSPLLEKARRAETGLMTGLLPENKFLCEFYWVLNVRLQKVQVLFKIFPAIPLSLLSGHLRVSSLNTVSLYGILTEGLFKANSIQTIYIKEQCLEQSKLVGVQGRMGRERKWCGGMGRSPS